MPISHARKYLVSKLIQFLESRIRFVAADGVNNITATLSETFNPIGHPVKIICKFLFQSTYNFIKQQMINDYTAKTILIMNISDVTNIQRTLQYLVEYENEQFSFKSAYYARCHFSELVVSFLEQHAVY